MPDNQKLCIGFHTDESDEIKCEHLTPHGWCMFFEIECDIESQRNLLNPVNIVKVQT